MHDCAIPVLNANNSQTIHAIASKNIVAVKTETDLATEIANGTVETYMFDSYYWDLSLGYPVWRNI